MTSHEQINDLDIKCFDEPTGNFRLILGDAKIKKENSNRLINPGTIKNAVIIAQGNIIERFKNKIENLPDTDNNCNLYSLSGQVIQKYSKDRKSNSKGSIKGDESNRVLSQVKIPNEVFENSNDNDDKLMVYIFIENYWKSLFCLDINRYLNNIKIDYNGFIEKNKDNLEKYNDKFKIVFVLPDSYDHTISKDVKELLYKKVDEIFDKSSFNKIISVDKILKPNLSVEDNINLLCSSIFGTFIGNDLSNVSSICNIQFNEEIIFSECWNTFRKNFQQNKRMNSLQFIGNFSQIKFICLLKRGADELSVNFSNRNEKLNTNISDLTKNFLNDITFSKCNEFIKDIHIFIEINKCSKYDLFSDDIKTEIIHRLFSKKIDHFDKDYQEEDNTYEWQKKLYEISYDINSKIHNKILNMTNTNYSCHLDKKNTEHRETPILTDYKRSFEHRGYLDRQQSHAMETWMEKN